MAIGSRLKHAWNAFNKDDAQEQAVYSETVSYGARPDRLRPRYGNERSVISAIYTRIGIDVAAVGIRHVRLDDKNRYTANIDSALNECLTVQANIDQAARQFRQDIVMTLFDEGVCAIVPVDTTLNPNLSGGYDIKNMRVGKIVAWRPQKVRVSLYNEQTGNRQELWLDKNFVAIVENPLYSVMNEPNSTLQRLIRKLNMLDAVDEASASGKLDLIIQLPYVIKSEARKQQAEQRRKDIEFQLKGSQYGIAYTDGTEKITQLNRPAENNLLTQVQYLTNLLYGQLGITEEVMNGTADEKTMLNYNYRTVVPILDAIVEAMRRSFLTKTARSQKQWIMYFTDPFKLVPINDIAEIADKFTRNEILTSNEVRQIVGFQPAQDPKADQLVNSNMPQSDTGQPTPAQDASAPPTDNSVMASSFDEIDSAIDQAFSGLGLGDDNTA